MRWIWVQIKKDGVSSSWNICGATISYVHVLGVDRQFDLLSSHLLCSEKKSSDTDWLNDC